MLSWERLPLIQALTQSQMPWFRFRVMADTAMAPAMNGGRSKLDNLPSQAMGNLEPLMSFFLGLQMGSILLLRLQSMSQELLRADESSEPKQGDREDRAGAIPSPPSVSQDWAQAPSLP